MPPNLDNATSKADVALILDNPKRDLSGIARLASELVQRKLSVAIVGFNIYGEKGVIESINPALILLNYYRKSNWKFVSRLRWKYPKIIFTALETEGLFPSLNHWNAVLPRKCITRSSLDAYFSWGAAHGNYLRTTGHFRKVRITVTGQPRFDVYASAKGRKLNSETRCILINTNFPLANPRFSTPALEAKGTALYTGERRAKALIERAANSLLEFKHLTRVLAKEFSNWEIRIRPHPFESPQPYEELVESHGNVTLSQHSQVDADLQEAAFLVQLDCTTGIEAALLGTPSAWPGWIPSQAEQTKVRKHLPKAETLEQLIGRIRSAIAEGVTRGTPNLVDTESLLSDYVCTTDGKSAERLAKTIENLVISRRTIRQIRWLLVPCQLATLPGHLSSILKDSIQSNSRKAESQPLKQWQRTAKRFGRQEIERALPELKDKIQEREWGVIVYP